MAAIFVGGVIKIYISIILYDRCKKIFFGGAPPRALAGRGHGGLFVGVFIKIYQ
jgi:hypothetical protein